MSRPDPVPNQAVGRASAEGYRAGADAVIPGEHVQFRNDGTRVTELTVVRRRGGRVRRDTLGLAPDDTISLPVPDGEGAVTVEVYAPETTATTAFAPGERPPLFSWTGGTLLVARD